MHSYSYRLGISKSPQKPFYFFVTLLIVVVSEEEVLIPLPLKVSVRTWEQWILRKYLVGLMEGDQHISLISAI
jgi:hypothetical protein